MSKTAPTELSEWLDAPGGGGKYLPNPDKPGRGWLYCPFCPPEKQVRESDIRTEGSERFRQLTGVCRPHSQELRKKPVRQRRHASGAIFLLGIPDPEKPASPRAQFICANFVNNKGCPLPDGKSYYWVSTLYDPKWHGFCRACAKVWLRNQGRPTTDPILYGWPETPGGPPGLPLAQILYSQEGVRGVPVKYLGGCRCAHTVFMTRRSVKTQVLLHRNGQKEFSKRCRGCFFNPEALLEQAQNSNGQNNEVAEKRGRGRAPKPPEVKQAEIERRKAEFEAKVRELGKRLPQHEITRAIIADEYANDDGEIPEDSTVGKWVREFYGSGVSVPAAVGRILNGTCINTDFVRENNSPI
jgi:hypothetical protein